MFIYGEWDPWTGGAFQPGDASDAHLFVDQGGTHSASINSLDRDDEEEAWAIISRWTGVTPAKTTVEPVDELHPPWRRSVPDRTAVGD